MLVELQYDLTRKQRLIPLLRVWGAAQILIIFGLLGVGVAVMQREWWVAFAVLLVTLWFGRGYVIGLCDVVFVSLKHMDIRIEDRGLGYLIGKERWYIFLDGLTAVRDLERNVWTITHWNGTVINIPKKILSDEVLSLLRDWVQKAEEYRKKHGIGNAKS